MELLESQDPDKKRLIETSERHKRAMEKEIGEFTKKTDRMMTNALIIGGSLALTFLLINSLSGKRKKKKKKLSSVESGKPGEPAAETHEKEEDDGPSILGDVGAKILNQATLVLLDIARQKISEYLATRKKTDDHS